MTERQQLDHIKFKWNSMTDELRWKSLSYIQTEHPDLILMLDNDDTYVIHKDLDAEDFILQFDEFIGWSDGIQILLKAFNIKAEPV